MPEGHGTVLAALKKYGLTLPGAHSEGGDDRAAAMRACGDAELRR